MHDAPTRRLRRPHCGGTTAHTRCTKRKRFYSPTESKPHLTPSFTTLGYSKFGSSSVRYNSSAAFVLDGDVSDGGMHVPVLLNKNDKQLPKRQSANCRASAACVDNQACTLYQLQVRHTKAEALCCVWPELQASDAFKLKDAGRCCQPCMGLCQFSKAAAFLKHFHNAATGAAAWIANMRSATACEGYADTWASQHVYKRQPWKHQPCRLGVQPGSQGNFLHVKLCSIMLQARPAAIMQLGVERT